MYKKQFYEKYALVSLIKCFSVDLQVILEDKFKYENPDFQSDVINVGIEVVEAITSAQGEERFIIGEYFGKGLDGNLIKKKAEERFKKFRGKIKVVDGLAVYSNQPKGFIMSSRLNLIQAKINQKLEKLNSHYKVFNNNWLYVFAHISTVHKEEIELLNINAKKVGDIHFDKVFINCIDTIYVLTVDGISSLEVSVDLLKEINEEVKKSF